VGAAIEDGAALMRGELRSKGVGLQEELAPDLAPVLGDRVQLQQVMLNLMMNSIEAMSAAPGNGRELVIRTRNQKLDVCVAVVRGFLYHEPHGMRLGCRSDARSSMRTKAGCKPLVTKIAAATPNSRYSYTMSP
jgi:hypothetical protein